MERLVFPIAETELYGRSRQRTQLLIKLFPCFVSQNTLSYSWSHWILVCMVRLCPLFFSPRRFENSWRWDQLNFGSSLAVILGSGT